MLFDMILRGISVPPETQTSFVYVTYDIVVEASVIDIFSLLSSAAVTVSKDSEVNLGVRFCGVRNSEKIVIGTIEAVRASVWFEVERAGEIDFSISSCETVMFLAFNDDNTSEDFSDNQVVADMEVK